MKGYTKSWSAEFVAQYGRQRNNHPRQGYLRDVTGTSSDVTKMTL
jgi:hypothetical protein